jgi:hypothetical protein
MILYELAFLEKDEGKMREQVNWATGKAGAGYQFLFVQATTQAYKGQLQSARELVRQAASSARSEGEPEVAAGYAAKFAFICAIFKNSIEARIAWLIQKVMNPKTWHR